MNIPIITIITSSLAGVRGGKKNATAKKVGKPVFVVTSIFLIIALIISYICAADTEWDVADPADGDSPTLGATEIREFKTAAYERLDVDHYFEATGGVIATETNDGGMHRQIQFQAPRAQPTMGADHGMLYMKDVDGGAGSYGELYWNGEQDYELQITELNTAGNAAALNLTGTYENEMALTNTGNSVYADLVACTDGGYLTLPHDSSNEAEGNVRYMADDDVETITYRTDNAWLTLLTSTTSGACQIKIGTYTGDDAATQAVTGVGFQPDAVLVLPLKDNRDCFIKTADMASTASKSLAGRSGDYVGDAIRALDADGFTVGLGTDEGEGSIAGHEDNINENTETYAYIAVREMD